MSEKSSLQQRARAAILSSKYSCVDLHPLLVPLSAACRSIRDFKEHLEQHQGDPEQIEEYCSDMSLAFIGGMAKEFPGAELTVDKFHVMKLINDALGVRPTERIRRILIQNQCSHAFESNDYAYNIRRLSTGFVSSDGLLI